MPLPPDLELGAFFREDEARGDDVPVDFERELPPAFVDREAAPDLDEVLVFLVEAVPVDFFFEEAAGLFDDLLAADRFDDALADLLFADLLPADPFADEPDLDAVDFVERDPDFGDFDEVDFELDDFLVVAIDVPPTY